MRVIFLDIDGVLHPAPKPYEKNFVTAHFTKKSMQCLRSIYLTEKNNDLRFVLSSEWRRDICKRMEIDKVLSFYGIPPIYDTTPVLEGKPRHVEIWQWIEDYIVRSREDPEKYPPIEGYCCLGDDDLGMGRTVLEESNLIKNFVRTPSSVGLSYGHVKRCSFVLNRTPNLPVDVGITRLVHF